MRRALEYAGGLGVDRSPSTARTKRLAAGGHMHEGEWSSRLGIPGQPAEAEELMVLRDIALARLTGAPVHFQHLSTARSVRAGARGPGRRPARHRRGHAAPLHAHRTPRAPAYDPVFKVNPPLRTEADVAGVRAGLADGALDAIATDHAPHAQEAKELPFDQAPPGMLGLETALALALTELDLPHRGRARAALVAARPRIAGLATAHGGPIAAGEPANLCVIDPAATWTVDPSRLASRSRNTPYAGRRSPGRVRHTLLSGEPVVIDGEAQR